MASFMTVNEAARTTGKSPSSIRRLLHPITKNDKHPDREHVQPSLAEVAALRKKGENFAWKLSDELIKRFGPTPAAAEKGTAGPTARPAASVEADLITMLRDELAIKNTQIAKQAEIIDKQMELFSGLSERLREGNLLIANLQQRLSLPAPREGKTVEQVKPKRPTTAEKGSTLDPKPAKPKKGFLGRWFG